MRVFLAPGRQVWVMLMEVVISSDLVVGWGPGVRRWLIMYEFDWSALSYSYFTCH